MNKPSNPFYIHGAPPYILALGIYLINQGPSPPPPANYHWGQGCAPAFLAAWLE